MANCSTALPVVASARQAGCALTQLSISARSRPQIKEPSLCVANWPKIPWLSKKVVVLLAYTIRLHYYSFNFHRLLLLDEYLNRGHTLLPASSQFAFVLFHFNSFDFFRAKIGVLICNSQILAQKGKLESRQRGHYSL